MNHPEVLGAVEDVFATCRERNLIYTLPVRTPEDVPRWQAAGMRMMTLSTDGALLATGARQFLANVKRATRAKGRRRRARMGSPRQPGHQSRAADSSGRSRTRALAGRRPRMSRILSTLC